MKIGPARIALVLTAAICSVGCAQTLNSRTLSVREITNHRAMLEGRQVTVQGFLRFTHHARNLWQSGEGFRELGGEGLETTTMDAETDCLAIFDGPSLVPVLLKNDKRYVRLTGRLVHHPLKEGEINLFRCSEWGISVEEMLPVGS